MLVLTFSNVSLAYDYYFKLQIGYYFTPIQGSIEINFSNKSLNSATVQLVKYVVLFDYNYNYN